MPPEVAAFTGVAVSPEAGGGVAEKETEAVLCGPSAERMKFGSLGRLEEDADGMARMDSREGFVDANSLIASRR